MDCLIDVSNGSEYALTRASYNLNDLVEGYDVEPRFGTSPGIVQGLTLSTRVGDGRRFVASSDLTFLAGTNVSPNRLYLHEYSQEFDLLSWAAINTGDEMLVRDILYHEDRILVVGDKMSWNHAGTIHGYLLIFDDRLVSEDIPVESDQEFMLRPNPVAENRIELSVTEGFNDQRNMTFRIFDLLGREHMSGKIVQRSHFLDIAQLPKGMYICEIWDRHSKRRAVLKFQRL